MRALLHPSFGAPESVLSAQEVDLPEPGPREVHVRLVLAPIHNHDLWTVRGTYGFKPDLPARAGTEAVGIVDAVGDEVTGLTVGQRVATGSTFGTWAEYFVAPAAGLIPVPDGLPDEVAAQLVSMPFSAVSLLHALALNEGDWLVQNAANGAVSRMVAQIGAARGFHVVGLVRRSEGVEELRAQGIGNIVATDTENWRDEVAALTGGAPIIAGVDSVGGEASGQIASLLGDGATLVVFGAMQSPVMQIPSGDVIFKQLTVKGFWGSKVSKEMDAATRGMLFGQLMGHIAAGELTLPVAGVFGLDDIAAAVEASTTAGRVGKVLLRP